MTENTQEAVAPTRTDRRTGGLPDWIAAIGHRWATWLAIAMAAVSVGGETPTSLSQALLVFALGYLATAVLQRRGATWAAAIVAIGALAVLRLQDVVDPSAVLLAAGLGLILVAAARGQLRSRAVMVETAGMVGFGALAMAGLAVDPELGLYLLAAAWFGHAIWDIAHLWADKVVARSFAEWCAVYDGLRAVGIFVLSFI